MECASGTLHPSFGSISGIVAKYGLTISDESTAAASVKETGSAMLDEIRQQEEEEQDVAVQRNREAREVPLPCVAVLA
jgi:hypothetical protein